MNATLLDLPSEAAETSVSCANCPALQRLERELGELRRQVSERRGEVGSWKSRHADAVKRLPQLRGELDQSQGQVRALQDKFFGHKSEKSAPSDRSNDLFDPEEVGAAAKKRGAQPGHAGHGRRDDSHLPVQEEFIPLPAATLGCPSCGKPAALMSAPKDSEVLEVDRPSGSKAIAQVKSGRIVLAFCWAPVRRDFVGVAQSWSELRPWAVGWLCRIRNVYHRDRERLREPLGSAEFQRQDALLRGGVEAMRAEAVRERSDPKLRQPYRKVLESLQEHWTGLAWFVEGPLLPMDHNASQRAGRGPIGFGWGATESLFKGGSEREVTLAVCAKLG